MELRGFEEAANTAPRCTHTPISFPQEDNFTLTKPELNFWSLSCLLAKPENCIAAPDSSLLGPPPAVEVVEALKGRKLGLLFMHLLQVTIIGMCSKYFGL